MSNKNEEKSVAIELEFSASDLASIAAACGSMAAVLMNEADCGKDIKEALHLTKLYARISAALEKAKKEMERNDDDIVLQ